MADDTTKRFNEMLSFFEGIRDERNTAANTASRIGRAFIMLLDYYANGVAGLYISKVKNDIANGIIDFLKGIKLNGSGTLTGVAHYPDTDEGSAEDVVTPLYLRSVINGFLGDLDGRYLSKLHDDIAQGIITFLKGIKIDDLFYFDENGNICANDAVFNGQLSSPSFISGFLDGKGWRINGESVVNAAGVQEEKYTEEIDNLIVRGSLRVFEMIISQLLGENDNRVFTAMLEVDHYDAETGKVYLDTNEGRYYNPFRKDDYIMVQQYNGVPSEDNEYYVTKRYELVVTEVGSEGTGENMLAWVKFRDFSTTMEGGTPETLIKKRDTFVRVDNLSNSDRKGIVTITTVGSDTPYLDIIYGLKTNPEDALKGRLGNLQGITHPLFGALKGFGEYLMNLYATSDIILRRIGESLDTKIQMLANIFATRYTRTQYELTDDDNYLHNGQFLMSVGDGDSDNPIIDGWTADDTDETSFWVDASGNPIVVNGYATAGGLRRVIIEDSEGRQVLRLMNCRLTQKNALIRQPGTHKEYSNPSGKENNITDSEGNNGVTLQEASDGSSKDVQDTLYVSIRLYALTSGKLTVGFDGCTDVEGKENGLAVRDIDISYAAQWQTVELSGKWNGTGDFVLRYSGDCRVAFAAITDTALANLARTVSTSIEQTSDAIKLLGQNDNALANSHTKLGLTVDALNKQVDIFVNTTYPNDKKTLDSRITVNENAISAIHTDIDGINKTVKQQEVDIDGLKNQVDIFSYANYQEDMTAIRNSIKVNTDGISANLTKINGLQGTVDTLGTEYDGLNSTVTTYVTKYSDSYFASLDSRITTNANGITAQSTRIGTAESNISSLTDKYNTLNGSVSTLTTQYGSLKTSYDSIQSEVSTMGVNFDSNGIPTGDNWKKAGILTTAEGNILYAGKGETNANILVGSGSGLLWTLEQSRGAASMSFDVATTQFAVLNYYPIESSDFSDTTAYATLVSPVAKVVKGQKYVLSLYISHETNVSFSIRIDSGSSKDSLTSRSYIYKRSMTATDDYYGDGCRRYYYVLDAADEYIQVRFINAVASTEVDGPTKTYSTEQINGDWPYSSYSDHTISDNTTYDTTTHTKTRVYVCYRYAGQTKGGYYVKYTETTVTTAHRAAMWLRRLQMEKAVADTNGNYKPSDYKEGQNTIESYIKQTVDSIELRASQIIFKGETVINDKFWVDTDGTVHMADAKLTGIFSSGSGTKQITIGGDDQNGEINVGGVVKIAYGTSYEIGSSFSIASDGGMITVTDAKATKNFFSSGDYFPTQITGRSVITDYIRSGYGNFGDGRFDDLIVGNLTAYGLALGTGRNVIGVSNGTYTLPTSNLKDGQVLILIQVGGGTVTFNSGTKLIYFGNSNNKSTTAKSSKNGQWTFFIYFANEGWYCVQANTSPF